MPKVLKRSHWEVQVGNKETFLCPKEQFTKVLKILEPNSYLPRLQLSLLNNSRDDVRCVDVDGFDDVKWRPQEMSCTQSCATNLPRFFRNPARNASPTSTSSPRPGWRTRTNRSQWLWSDTLQPTEALKATPCTSPPSPTYSPRTRRR